MENHLNKSLPVPNDCPPAHSMSFFSGFLAFVLSAAMAIGFIALVNKTHDLLSAAQFDVQIGVRQ
ncbi:MAG: hypothetical protein M3R68_06340 [Acidobacteriota bacterium]|nr:hypothetical protein [Acidobacteriota bacterium]